MKITLHATVVAITAVALLAGCGFGQDRDETAYVAAVTAAFQQNLDDDQEARAAYVRIGEGICKSITDAEPGATLVDVMTALQNQAGWTDAETASLASAASKYLCPGALEAAVGEG